MGTPENLPSGSARLGVQHTDRSFSAGVPAKVGLVQLKWSTRAPYEARSTKCARTFTTKASRLSPGILGGEFTQRAALPRPHGERLPHLERFGSLGNVNADKWKKRVPRCWERVFVGLENTLYLQEPTALEIGRHRIPWWVYVNAIGSPNELPSIGVKSNAVCMARAQFRKYWYRD